MTERPITIMIVDDHVVIRSGLRMLIEHDQQMRVIAMAGNQTEAQAHGKFVTHGDHPFDGPKPSRSRALAVLGSGGLGLWPLILPDQGAFAARPPKNDSYNSPITPATMAESARLNTYQVKLNVGVVIWNRTKSMTAP